MSSGNATIQAGAVTFAMMYRRVTDDGGVTIHVMGNTPGNEKELLRFDCFDHVPHYHYAPLEKNERYNLDKVTAGPPIDWTMRQLRARLPDMLRHAGYSDVASSLDRDLVSTKLDEVEEAARSMAAAGTGA